MAPLSELGEGAPCVWLTQENARTGLNETLQPMATPANNSAGVAMKTFVLACVAASAIAAVAGFALNSVQRPADQAYSTTGVRL